MMEAMSLRLSVVNAFASGSTVGRNNTGHGLGEGPPSNFWSFCSCRMKASRGDV